MASFFLLMRNMRNPRRCSLSVFHDQANAGKSLFQVPSVGVEKKKRIKRITQFWSFIPQVICSPWPVEYECSKPGFYQNYMQSCSTTLSCQRRIGLDVPSCGAPALWKGSPVYWLQFSTQPIKAACSELCWYTGCQKCPSCNAPCRDFPLASPLQDGNIFIAFLLIIIPEG